MADDPFRQSVDNLVDAMRGREMTGNWDILVSYNREKLNDLLGKIWEDDAHTDAIEFLVPLPKEHVYCRLELGKPHLKFESDNKATLSIPITGGTVQPITLEVDFNSNKTVENTTGQSEYNIIPPDCFQLNVTAPLVSIAGQFGDDDIDKNAEVSVQDTSSELGLLYEGCRKDCGAQHRQVQRVSHRA